MSSIIAKPFDWTKKIVKAVFRGSPNLITAEDLNREIEALKKELYLLRQGNRYIISDFRLTNYPGGNITAAGTYVFVEGMKILVDMNVNLTPQSWENMAEYDINLYAEKTLVEFDDDPTHEISGAKFADGTAYPAADHYVYNNPQISLVKKPTPDADFVYPQVDSKDYVCTLGRLKYNGTKTYAGDRFWWCSFCVRPNEGRVGATSLTPTYLNFPMEYIDASKSYNQIPAGGLDIANNLKRVWSRLYNLERRLFLETCHNTGTIDNTITINGATFSNHRHAHGRARIVPGLYIGTWDIYFIIIGPICYLHGVVLTEEDLALVYGVSLVQNKGDAIPRPLKHTSCNYIGEAVPVDDSGNIIRGGHPSQFSVNNGGILNIFGASDNNNTPTTCRGYKFSISYPIESHKWWKPAVTDANMGNFDDFVGF